jgi:hypothetical protein
MFRVLLVIAVAAGLFEFALAPFIDAPAIAVVFGVAFLTSALWLDRRPGAGPVVALATLFLVELAALPTYPRESAGEWASQIAFGLLSAVGLATALAVLVTRRRAAATR